MKKKELTTYTIPFKQILPDYNCELAFIIDSYSPPSTYIHGCLFMTNHTRPAIQVHIDESCNKKPQDYSLILNK